MISKNFLYIVFKVKQTEQKKLILMFLFFFFLIAGNILGINIVNSLFVSSKSWGYNKMPLMFMLLSVVTIISSCIFAMFADIVSRAKIFSFTLKATFLFTLIARLAFKFINIYLIPVLYVVVQFIWLICLMQFWTIANDICSTREGKRLFSLFAVGGLCGSIVSGFLTRYFVPIIHTENLFLIWNAFIIGANFIFTKIKKNFAYELRNLKKQESKIKNYLEGLNFVKNSSYLKSVAIAVFFLWICVYIIDYQYFKYVSGYYKHKDDITALYGAVRGTSSTIALILQLFVTSRLLSILGVPGVLFIFPALSSISLLFVVLSPKFEFAVFTRGMRIVMLYSLQDASYQLLFNPVQREFRGRARAFIDGIVMPAGVFVSGLTIFLFSSFTKLRIEIIGVVTAFIWIILTFRLKKEYIKALIKNLNDTDYDVRFSAISALAKLKDKSCVKPLIEALNDKSPEIRLNAINALANNKSKEAIPYFKKALNDEDEYVRAAAANAIGKIKDTQATQYLISKLNIEKTDRVKATIVKVLGQLGDISVIDTLKQNLNAKDARVRANTIEVLDSIGCPDIVNLTKPLLFDANNRVKANAAVVIFNRGNSEEKLEAAHVLWNMLNHKDKWMRASACCALGMIGREEHVNLLLNHLKDTDKDVRRNALKSLIKILPLEHIEKICNCCFVDMPGKIAQELKRALLNSKKIFISRLIDKFSTLNPQAQEFVIEVACECNINNILKIAKKFLLSEEIPVNLKIAAIKATARLKDYDSLQILLDLLESTDDRIKATVATAIVNFDEKIIKPKLLKVLNSPNPRVVSNALESLIKLNTSDILNIIENFINHPNYRVRALAARILISNNDPHGKATLLNMIESQDKWARVSAAYTMGELEDPQNIPILIKLLSDSDADVRKNAIIALEKLGEQAVDSLISRLDKADKPPEKDTMHSKHPPLEKQKAIKEILLEMLADDNLNEEKIVNMLDKIDNEKIEKAFNKVLETDLSMKIAAISALEEYMTSSNEEALKVIIPMLNDTSLNMRIRAVKILLVGEIIPPYESILKFIKLQINSFKEYKNTIYVCKKFNIPALVYFVEYLKKKIKIIEESLIDVLMLFGQKETVKLAAGKLTDSNKQIRSTAIEALESTVDKKISRLIIPVFEELDTPYEDNKHIIEILSEYSTNSEDPEERILAFSALFEYIENILIQPLISATGEKNYDVRKKARELLERLKKIKIK